MTREEAISLLDNRLTMRHKYSFQSETTFYASPEKVNEALDMAISALRAQQQPNDWICTLKCTALMEEGMCSHGGLCCLHESQRTIEENAPLTLEQLHQMDGEPVWIKLFDPDEEFWVLRNEWVDTRNPEPLILFHMRWYSHADYGKTWLAYRQKPEEGTV